MTSLATPKAGSLTGAILLIAGCCIGAGMLGLPVMTALAGFEPSFVMFIVSWLFMTTTALLLLEVNLWFKDDVSIMSMADRTLGPVGKWVGGFCFLFLFYALGVAYIAGSGELITAFLSDSLSLVLPNWIGSLLVSILFGMFVYLGTQSVDRFNRVLMSGLVISYILLVGFGAPYVSSSNFDNKDWSLAAMVLPVMIISFGFHNMIPSLTTYLERDAKRLRLAIICGSAIPLMIYLVWEWLILGLVSVQGNAGFLDVIEEGNMATHVLKNAVGKSSVLLIAQYFAFFAILTSFLGNSLSFVDFLADGLQLKKTHQNKFLLCLLVIVPPFVLAVLYPHIFLTALHYAGAFGAVILFGILPALMVWSGRYYKKFVSKPLVPGGKVSLLVIIIFALSIMALQFVEMS